MENIESEVNQTTVFYAESMVLSSVRAFLLNRSGERSPKKSLKPGSYKFEFGGDLI